MLDLSFFVKDFASARTFVFVREIESLIDKDLIKGGDLDNAIIIYDQVIQQDKLDNLSDMLQVKKRNANQLVYMMNKPLNTSNEPARHKLLDIIGDIALVEYFIKGKIEANRSGNANADRKLYRSEKLFGRYVRSYKVFLRQQC